MSATTFLGSATAVDMDGLLTHTTQWIEKKQVIQDAIFAANPVFYELRKNGSIAPGGTDEAVNLMYGKNNTFGWYHRYDVLNTDPQDGMTVAYYPWGQASIAVSIDGLSTLQNAGPAKIKDLIQSKMTQATMSIAEDFNTALWVNTAVTAERPYGGKGIYSIPMLIDADSDRDRAIAGINGSTEAHWRNNTLTGSTNTAVAWKMYMSNMYNECQKQGKMGGAPNLIVKDQESYEKYENSMVEQRRYTSDDRAGAGYKHLYFKDAKIVWDDKVPDAIEDTQTVVKGAMYYINTNFMTLRVLGGRDWKWGKWVEPIDQDAKVNKALWAGQLVVTNRRKHGVIHTLSKAVFT